MPQNFGDAEMDQTLQHRTDHADRERSKESYFKTEHLKGTLKSRAVKGGGIVVFARAVNFLVHMLGTVVLARILTPEDFGLLAMVLTITGFFVLFKDLGLSEATIQSQSINHRQVSTLFWVNVFFALAILVVIMAISPLVARFYNEPKLQPIIIVSALSFLFAGFTTQHMAILKRNMQFSRIATVEIVAALGSISVAVIMALAGMGYWALVARPVALSVLNFGGMWFFCSWRPGLPVRDAGVMGLIRFGANTMGFYLVNYFARNLDKALIGWASGPVALGFYHKAYHLFVLPVNQFSIPLQSVAVTTLTKLRSEPERYRAYFVRAISLLAFVGMPMSTFLAALGDEIILILLGPQWDRAAEIFSILGLGAGMQIMYATQGWLHISLGRADRWFWWGVVGSAVMVLFFVAGLPFGTRGVAAGYTVSLYLLTGPALWYAGRPVKLTVKELVAGVWSYYVAAAVAGGTTWYLASQLGYIQVFLRLAICSVSFALLYLFSVVVLHGSFRPLKENWNLFVLFKPVKNKSGKEKKI
ncbi:MAG: lipopolysaccharide biosynthesis protein [Chitinispirillaceae bacterium]